MQKLTTHELQNSIPLGEAARFFPSRPTIYTLLRWRKVGVLNRQTGKRVKLRTIRLGGLYATTEEWAREFIEAISVDVDPTAPRRQVGAAEELAAMGI